MLEQPNCRFLGSLDYQHPPFTLSNEYLLERIEMDTDKTHGFSSEIIFISKFGENTAFVGHLPW